MSDPGIRPPRLGLVVPVYNEARRLRRSVAELVSFAAGEPGGVELVFVDDGSTDATSEVLRELVSSMSDTSVRLISRPHEGKGAAVAAGLRELAAPIGAFCDLDLATPLDDLRRVIAVAESAGVLAIGSRDLPNSVLERPEHPLRELAGRAYNRLLQATITPGIVDTQCGAKAARREVWADVLDLCDEPGFSWDAELIAVCLRLGIPVSEVPIRWRHDGDSKVRVARDGLAMVRAVARIRRRVRRLDSARREPKIRADEVFDDARAVELLDAGRDHWWFRSKAAFVSTALRRTHHGQVSRDGGRLVDVGAGAGAVTAMLGWPPGAAIVVDGNLVLARHARLGEGLASLVGRVEEVPLATGTAAAVCLLDVIEHLDEPEHALVEAHRLLHPAGRLVVNVPAHPRLWSAADEHLGHRRRYTRRMLRDALERRGFSIVVCTHVFSWLVVPVWLRRRLGRSDAPELGLETRGGPIDVAAMGLTFAERQLIGRMPLPFGTSILAVARPVERR